MTKFFITVRSISANQFGNNLGAIRYLAVAKRSWESPFTVESPGGFSPPGAPRSVREPLDSYGSRCSAVSMTELPVGEECWICSA